MGLLADVYSYGDTMKRKVRGLLDDPRGTLEQFVGQLGDDTNTNIRNMQQGYGFGGQKATDSAQVAAAQKALADYGAQAGMAAATVWHGSPHKFDKFDASKIGTGEGAQAYGHGIYTAEAPVVAKEYAEKLSSNGQAKNLTNQFGDIDGAIAEAQKRIANYKDMIANGGGGMPERAQRMLQISEKSLQDLQAMKAGRPDPTGYLYKVDLPDEHIAKMLDWDKPLSEQHPDVQRALQSQQVSSMVDSLKKSGQLGNYSAEDMAKFRGEDWHDFIRQASGDSNVAPSEFLRQQGIPGIRYLDGGSRGTGAGTSNFVVFPGNENLLQILERNGQPIKGLLGQ